MLTYDLSRRDGAALYDYLYRCIRCDIEQGAIAFNQKLPSKRSLAEHLGVSLVTVEGAYAQLVAEGYVRAVPRTGYFAEALPAMPSADDLRESADAGRDSCPNGPGTGDKRVEGDFSERIRDDRYDKESRSAPFEARTARVWARAVRRELALLQDAGLSRAMPHQGSPRLRRAIARHLRRFRGMDVDPARVVVGAGAQVLYNLLVQLAGRDRIYAVEDPGYPLLSRLYEANEARVAFLPVDESGMIVEGLRACGAHVAHVMPSHQFPTGAIMSVSRRYELLSWAAEDPARIIVEDDYDCEFRMAGRPVPSLQSIDSTGSVVYANTFSKSLGSDMRIAYMVLPRVLMERFDDRLGFYSNTVSSLLQDSLARILETGEFERHALKLKTAYRTVRDEFIRQIRNTDLRRFVSFENMDGGLHFLIALDRALVVDADVLSDELFRRCASLRLLSSFSRKHAYRGGQVRIVADVSRFSHLDAVSAARSLERSIEAARIER